MRVNWWDHRKRFKEITRDVQGITDKSLSKELKLLQANKLVIREVKTVIPATVQYMATEHGRSVNEVLYALWDGALLIVKKSLKDEVKLFGDFLMLPTDKTVT
ncbi:winged helix-turn-helix transcriptional regulator [Arcticibacter sp. MXS-1]|uniref:winged helix-turn-helix transcriptional regulator n=1 Tax=Arcticibacter sp. MXS-1 TaxID=3341726 RepID=UPI0035A910F2